MAPPNGNPTAMTYLEYKTRIRRHLACHAGGPTRAALREIPELPWALPCAEWTRRLEHTIGLVRCKGEGGSLRWTLAPRHEPSR